MREIKFRAWDIEREEYLPENYEFHFTLDGRVLNRNINHYVLEQYTGLKDENGVDIYEGDIVKIIEEDEDSVTANTFEYIAIVCWENGNAEYTKYVTQYTGCFQLISKKFYMEQALFYAFVRSEFEVIGNIHQNPELLELPKPEEG